MKRKKTEHFSETWFFKWILEDRPFFSAKFSYDRNQNLVDKTVTFYDK